MRTIRWNPPPEVVSQLVVLAPTNSGAGTASISIDDPVIAECAAIPADVWFALANWAKQTGNLSSWQRQLAFGIGTRISRGRPPSSKQAQHGKRILDEGRRLGFDFQ